MNVLWVRCDHYKGATGHSAQPLCYTFICPSSGGGRKPVRSEFPDQKTPDALFLSPGMSQERDSSFVWPSLPSLSACLCLRLILPLSLSSLPSFLSSIAFLDAPKPPSEDRFVMPDEFAIPATEETGRAKRSPINSNRVGGLNVETLVVADRKMLEKHGRDNVTTYVLTVMNMVRQGQGGWGKIRGVASNIR